MAVHCGVCGGGITSASENGGSFPTLAAFAEHGWTARISDTCESCSRALTEAVTTRAIEIAKNYAPRVTALKMRVDKEKARLQKEAEEKAAFEKAWRERKP